MTFTSCYKIMHGCVLQPKRGSCKSKEDFICSVRICASGDIGSERCESVFWRRWELILNRLKSLQDSKNSFIENVLWSLKQILCDRWQRKIVYGQWKCPWQESSNLLMSILSYWAYVIACARSLQSEPNQPNHNPRQQLESYLSPAS